MEGSNVTGTCLSMCPLREIKLRERENLLHFFEVGAGHTSRRPRANYKRCVKEYRRPTVGKVDVDPGDLRPAKVLMGTVDYLIDSITTLDVRWVEIYDFVFDRLRAIRQDLVIQDLQGRETIHILEKVIRFHIYTDYRMCMEDISVFSQKINNQHTLECMTRLLNLYTSCDMSCDHSQSCDQTQSCDLCYKSCDHSQSCDLCNKSCDQTFKKITSADKTKTSNQEFDKNNLTKDRLDTKLSNHCKKGSENEYLQQDESKENVSSSHDHSHDGVELHDQSGMSHDQRVEFEVTYLLYNLGEEAAIKHYYSLDHRLRKQKTILLAYDINMAYLQNNWVRVFRLIRRLDSPIHLYAVHRHFSDIQRRALYTMNTGYSSKNLKYPLDALTSSLWFNTDTETQTVCLKMNISVVGTSVQFLKSRFDNSVKIERTFNDYISTKMRGQAIPDILHGVRSTQVTTSDNTVDELTTDFYEMCQT